MTRIHWIATFVDSDGREFAWRPVQVDHAEEDRQAEADRAARAEWPDETARSQSVSVYPHAEVDENGCHAKDGQKLLTPAEWREAVAAEEHLHASLGNPE